MPRKKKIPRRIFTKDERDLSESRESSDEAQVTSPSKSSSNVGTGKHDIYRQQMSPARTETRTCTVVRTPSEGPLCAAMFKLKLGDSDVSPKSDSKSSTFQLPPLKPSFNIEIGESSRAPEVKEGKSNKLLNLTEGFSRKKKYQKEKERKRKVLKWKRRLAKAKRKYKEIDVRKDNLIKNEKLSQYLLGEVIKFLELNESLRIAMSKNRTKKSKNILKDLWNKAELIVGYSEKLKEDFEEAINGIDGEKINYQTLEKTCREHLTQFDRN